jgi:hypothetical protein
MRCHVVCCLLKLFVVSQCCLLKLLVVGEFYTRAATSSKKREEKNIQPRIGPQCLHIRSLTPDMEVHHTGRKGQRVLYFSVDIQWIPT